MRTIETRAFVNQIVVWALVTICFGGSVGLGTVWMRHQISLTAKINRDLLAQISALDRNLTEIKSLVESEQSTEILKQRNVDMRLGLEPVTESQLWHVQEDPVRHLAARVNRDLFNQEPRASSFHVALGQ